MAILGQTGFDARLFNPNQNVNALGRAIQGIGQGLALYQQGQQQQQQQQVAQQKQQATSEALIRHSRAMLAGDEAAAQQAVEQLIRIDPENAKALLQQQGERVKQALQQAQRQKVDAEREQIGAEDPLDARRVQVQEENTRLRREQLRLDKLKQQEQSATNAENRKRIQAQVERLQQQIDQERQEFAAKQKGPDAQQILTDAKEAERKASSFAYRMTDANSQLNNLEQSIDPTARVIPLISGGQGVASEIANRSASPQEQQYASAASDFVTAVLRKESGAAIGDAEFDRKYRELFPVPGDSQEQIITKRDRRAKAVEAMKAESGRVYGALYGDQEQAEAPEAKTINWSDL